MRKALSLLLLACLSVGSPLLAQNYCQWEPEEGLPVSAGSYLLTSDIATFEDTHVIAWTESFLHGMDLFCQAYDATGEPLWGETPVSFELDGNQSHPRLLATETGDWLLAWSELTDMEQDRLYFINGITIQKLNNEGEPQWDENGLVIADTTIPVACPTLFPAPDNGVYVLWHKYGEGEIWGQHVSADGTFLWEDGGIVLASGATTYWPSPERETLIVFPAPDGGMLLVWKEVYHTSEVHTQRITPEGELLWAAGDELEEGLTVSPSVVQGSFAVATNSDGELIFLLRHESLPCPHLTAQKVDLQGNLCWDTDEITYIPEELSNINVFLELNAVQSDNGSILFSYTAGQGLYLQKLVDTEDGPVFSWPDAGMEMDTDYGELISFTSDDNDGAILCFHDFSFHYLYPISQMGILHVHGNGISSPLVSIDLGDRPFCKPFKHCLSDGVFSFISKRWCGPDDTWRYFDRYSVNIDNGTILIQADNLNFAEGFFCGITNTAIVQPCEPRDAVWIAWEDQRDGYTRAYAQQLAIEDGSPLGHPDPIAVFHGPDQPENAYTYELLMHTIADEVGNLYLASYSEDDPAQLNLQKVTPDLETLWGDNGLPLPDFVPVSRQVAGSNYARILPDQSGGMVVAYTDTTDEGEYTVRLKYYTAFGDNNWLQHGESGLRLESNYPFNEIAALEKFANGNILIVVRSAQDPDDCYDLYCHVITADGELVLNQPILLDDSEENQIDIQTVPFENAVQVTWDNRYGPDWTSSIGIRGGLVYADGTLRNNQPQTLIDSHISLDHYAVCTSSTDSMEGYYIVWHEMQNGLSRLRLQRFTWDGTPCFQEENGIPITTGFRSMQDVRINYDGFEGVWVEWVEWSYALRYQVRYTHLDHTGSPIDETYPYDLGLSLANSLPTEPILNSMVLTNNGCVVCWSTMRNPFVYNHEDLFAQRLDDFIQNDLDEQVGTLPGEWRLDSPYPNPFNPITQVHFSVAHSGMVTLTVYDMLGREVTELANQRFTAGQHVLQWDGSSLASGIYFIRLEADGFRASRKAVLLK